MNFRLLCTHINDLDYLQAEGINAIESTLDQMTHLQAINSSLFWGYYSNRFWVGRSIIGFDNFIGENPFNMFFIDGKYILGPRICSYESISDSTKAKHLLKSNLTDKPYLRNMIVFTPTKVLIKHFIETKEVSH